jgi:hypothetical protein
MAAFPARDRDAFMAHWAKIRADEALMTRAILLDGQVVGNIGSWEHDRKRLVGYWIGKSYWGRGVATRALSAFLGVVKARPLYAHVAKHNIGSIRVLEKCGFTMCRAEPMVPPAASIVRRRGARGAVRAVDGVSGPRGIAVRERAAMRPVDPQAL